MKKFPRRGVSCHGNSEAQRIDQIAEFPCGGTQSSSMKPSMNSLRNIEFMEEARLSK
jgi:hypothetical protein